MGNLERDWMGSFKAQNALKHLEALCKIEDRFAGRPGDVEAAYFMRDFFEGLGMKAELFPVKVPSFHAKEVSLTLETGETLDAVPFYFCKATPEGGVGGELLYIGSKDALESDITDLHGKIAVVDTPTLYMGKYIKAAAEKGAVALVVLNDMPHGFGMSAEAGFSDPHKQFFEAMIPAVNFGAKDGFKIMRAIGAGKTKAKLLCDTEITEKESFIAVGIYEGSELPEESVGIIAHRDVVVDPGANDNGSGTATMMEIARLISGQKTKRTALFISSTGEEGVTWGSYLYTKAKEEALRGKMKGLFNFDMFGAGGKLNLVGKGYWPDTGWMSHSEELNTMLIDIAEEAGYEIGLMEADWGVSESDRFQSIGVPSIWFWKDGDPNYHTPYDTLENVDGNALKVVGDVTGIAMMRLLNQ